MKGPSMFSLLHKWIFNFAVLPCVCYSFKAVLCFPICLTACFYRGVTVLPHLSSDSSLQAFTALQRCTGRACWGN